MKLGLAFSCSSMLAFVITGCATASVPNSMEESGSDSGVATKDSGAAKDSGSKPLKDSGVAQQDSGGSNDDASTPLDDTSCDSESTKADCEQCCTSLHSGGYDIYHTQLVQCACTSPAPCANVCASELCANMPTTSGDACETCITASLTSGTGACYDAVANACQADTDCTDLFSTCIPPCESK